MRLSRCNVRDHINCCKNDRWPSYRFYSALQLQKSLMRYICEIFGTCDFRVFQHNRGKNGHQSSTARSRLLTDIVAKVFLGWRTKILRAADAFCKRRREGPYRFIQNRPGTSIVALKSVTAAEESKDQLSRDFSGRSIFDFCNNIDPKRTLGSEPIERRL